MREGGRGAGVLRVYGPAEPAPVIEEAGMVFATRRDVKVELIAGPRNI